MKLYLMQTRSPSLWSFQFNHRHHIRNFLQAQTSTNGIRELTSVMRSFIIEELQLAMNKSTIHSFSIDVLDQDRNLKMKIDQEIQLQNKR